MSLIRSLICSVLVGATLFAQAPQFDVASIRASADQGNAVNAGLRITGTQVRIVSLSLKDYVALAYRMRPAQVVVPEWAAQLRFDVSANLPDGAARDQDPAMLQSLLEQRFQMKVHRETREFPVYAITVAKSGLKISGTPIDPSAPPPSAIIAGGSGSGAGVVINLGGESTFSLADNKVEVRKLTMAQLADAVTRFTDRAVIDATSLPDRYDFTLDLTPEDYQFVLMRAGANAGVTLPPQALRLLDAGPSNALGPYFEKVGLALESRRAPLEVVVVDSALKTPIEN
jgi:uncharacterized protein (TIGR03435 family)